MDCQTGCKQKNHHLTSCTTDECWGCKPEPAVDLTIVCGRCCDAFRLSLIRIVNLWPDLQNRLGQGMNFRFRDRVSGTPEIGLVLNEQVMAVEANVRHWAVFVHRLLVSEAGLKSPEFMDTLSLLRFARDNTDWLLTTDLAADLVADAKALLRSVTNGAYPRAKRKLTIPDGVCLVEVEAGPCGGQLYAIFHSDDDRLPAMIHCKSDASHRLEPHQWVEFGRRLRELAEI